MNHILTRRKFIANASSLSAFILLSPNVLALPRFNSVNSTKGTPQFIVVLTTDGGLDCTLGLDPQIYTSDIDANDIFIEYRSDEILAFLDGNIRLAPAAVSLKPFVNDLVIFNGIDMKQDLGHTRSYITSGVGNSDRSSCSLDLANAMGTGPFGVLNSGFVHKSPSNSTMISDINKVDKMKVSEHSDLLDLTRCDSDSEDPIICAENAYVALNKIYPEFRNQLHEIRKDSLSADPAGSVVAAAFITGASRQAEIDLTQSASISLDTHSNHEKRHLQGQKAVWDRVAQIFKLFKNTPYGDGSLFDATLFYFVTEFSRTPYLNGSSGKDHNIETNSVLLAGGGIRGGQTIGGSQVIARTYSNPAIHMGLPIDFVTGRTIDFPQNPDLSKVGALQPAHIIRTIGKIFGDPEGFLDSGKIAHTPWIRSVIQ